MTLAVAIAFGITALTFQDLEPPRPATDAPFVAQAFSEPDRLNLERNLRWILRRQRDGSGASARVGVFADAGVWHPGARSIVQALESDGVPCLVLDRSMIRADILDGLDALVIPGGWAPFQRAALGQSGLAAIQRFVQDGGRCLGICAGAYLLARTTRYQNVDYPYPLGLFDGTARGPVPGLPSYPDAAGASLTVTRFGSGLGLSALTDQPLYYNGGPCFLGGTGIGVLARYRDGTPAAIRKDVGKGRVLLIGVHPERPAPDRGGDDAPPPLRAGEVLRALLEL